MFCGKCGAVLPDDAQFCNKCGNIIKAKKPSADSDSTSENGFAASSAVDHTPENAVPEASVSENQNKPKKVRKGLGRKGKTVLISVAASMAVLAIIALFAWQGIARLVVGDVGYYFWREAKTMEKALGISDMTKDMQGQKFSAHTTFSFDSPDGAGEFGEMLENGNPVLDCSFDKGSQKGVFLFSADMDGTRKTLFKIDYEKGNVNFSYPYLIEMMNADNVQIAGLPDSIAFRIDSKNDTISPFIEVLIKTCKKVLKDNAESSRDEVNGKSCRVIKITLDGEDLSELIDTFYENVKNDKKAVESFDTILKYVFDYVSKAPGAPSVFDGGYDDFRKKAVEAIESFVEDAVYNLGESDIPEIEFAVAFDSRGYVVNRTLKIDGEVYADIDSKISSGSAEITAKFSDPYGSESYKFTYKREKSGGKTDITINGNDEFIIKAKELDIEKNNGIKVLTGKLTVSYDGETVSMKAVNGDTYDLVTTVDDASFTISTRFGKTPDLSEFETPPESDLVLPGAAAALVPAGVGVAIPIFTATTKNAAAKSCKANMRVIKGNMETYQSTGGYNGEEIVFPYGDTVLSETKPSGFMKLFDGGTLPVCPTHKCPYYVCVRNNGTTITYIVRCTDETCDHNS